MSSSKGFTLVSNHSGIKTYHRVEGGRDVYLREQDCEPIVNEVKRIKEVSDGRGDTSLGYFVGKIPGEIVEKYLQEKGVSYHDFIVNPEHVKRIMNNPDYKKFRIFEGKM